MPSLGCHESLTLYSIDALGHRDRRAVEKHLPHCARCRTRLIELDETGALIKRESGMIDGEATAPPRALLPRILAGAGNQSQPSQGLKRPLRRLLLALGLAISSALALFAVWPGSHRASLDRRPSTQA